MPRLTRSSVTAKGLEDLLFEVQLIVAELGRVLQTLSFGNGSESDNIDGVWISVTTHATPGTEIAFTHNLGRIPVGYFVLSKDKAGHIYDGSTAWTDELIYLRSDVATVAALVFVI